MSHSLTNLIAATSFNESPAAGTPPLIVPANSSSSAHNIGQTTADPGAIESSSFPVGVESAPNTDTLHTCVPHVGSAQHKFAVRCWKKALSTISQRKSPPTHPTVLPAHPPAIFIGLAIMVSGLVAVAPVHAVSLPPIAFCGVPADDVDLNQAKCALRVLSALGDGITGIPWLKGAAALGLEIANTLDVSPLSRWLKFVDNDASFSHDIRTSSQTRSTAGN